MVKKTQNLCYILRIQYHYQPFTSKMINCWKSASQTIDIIFKQKFNEYFWWINANVNYIRIAVLGSFSKSTVQAITKKSCANYVNY